MTAAFDRLTTALADRYRVERELGPDPPLKLAAARPRRYLSCLSLTADVVLSEAKDPFD